MSDTTGIRSKGKDRWEIRFSANGTPVSRIFKGTKKAAQRERRRYLREAEAGKWNHREKTFQLLADDWFDQAQRKLSPTTIRAYRQNLKLHILPALGPIPLHRLSVADLDKLYMALEDDDKAPRTIKQCHAIISRALRQGQIWGWVPKGESPAKFATLPRIPEGEIHPPTVDQVHKLVAAAEELDPLMAVIIFVAADTGARRGELCGLRWTDFDPIERTVTFRQAIVPVPGGIIEKDTKTHQRRTVALWAPTVEGLARHRQNVLQSARLARVSVAPDAFVFSREPDGSRALHPDSVTAAFGVIRDAVGLKVRFHDLRHFVGSELVARGVPLPAVSRRLGHRHVSTTADIYAHPTDESSWKAAQVIGELLSPDAQKSPHPLPGGDPAGEGEADGGC